MKTQYKILKVLLKNLKISKNLRIPVAMVSTAAYRLGDMASWLLGQDGSTVRHAVLRRRVRSVSVVPARAAPEPPPRGRTFFTPRAFPERVAKRWGRVALEGRAPPTRRTIRTDAPGPPNPSVIPSGTPRASHDRRRTSSGPRAPRREVRPVPKLFPSPHGHLGRRWTIVFFFSPRPLALPRGRAPSRRI